ncbi:hypothetical protein ACQ4PT_057039 [Festuca glaucescens]
MKRLVPRIRASYSEEMSKSLGARSDNEVAEMMLKDGCFILHRLLKYARCAKMEEADDGNDRFGEDDEDWTQVYGRCFIWQFVTGDLLLLENQIPFFLIRELFQQLRNEDEPEELLVTGGLRLFWSLRPQMLHRLPIACDDVHHLLHLFYLSVGLPATDRKQQQQHSHRRRSDELLSELPQWIPCAKELEEAGVRFRKRKNATSFLDVKFARGVLEIPQLELNDSSEPLFRNLIAFEQTYPHTARDVSTYAVFMNCLVTSEEDMRILDLHGILVNHLNHRRCLPWRFFSDIVAQVHWSTDNYLVNLMSAVNSLRSRRACSRGEHTVFLVLEIPQLELNDSSEPLFRNLIAFEQTYPHTARDVSTYAVFMNCLVTSEEDMRILDLHGILVNHLNHRRCLPWRFFSDIVAQVHWSTDNYLVNLMSAVNRYRDRRRHKWRAALVRATTSATPG